MLFFSYLDRSLCNYVFSVVKNGKHIILFGGYKRMGVADDRAEGYMRMSNDLIAQLCVWLIFCINADCNCLVTLHTNVLYVGAVYVFYCIYRIFHKSGHFACVAFQHEVFHIRALLEHIRGIFDTVERERKYLYAIGIVYVDRNVKILTFLCIIDLFRRSYHLDDCTYCILNGILSLFLVEGVSLVNVTLFFARSIDRGLITKIKRLHALHIYRRACIRCLL